MAKSTKKLNKIYMDYASGALPNPSGMHTEGVTTKKKLETAREEVAHVLGARAKEIIFTSGGTESNNLAIQGIVLAHKKPHIITTNIEHSSVLETFRLLEKRGLAEITIVPVEESGIVDPQKIAKVIKKNTLLISVMYANNEIGTIQPIKEIAKMIRHYKKISGKDSPLQKWKGLSFPVFHTDAVQAVNYLDLNVERLGVDLLTLSGTKIVGAGRVGVLYKRNNVKLEPIFGGGDQEMNIRPGTENVPAIVAFTKALGVVQKNKDQESARLTKLRDYFIHQIQYSNILKNTRILINGNLENRLPNNVNITIPNIPSDLLVLELDARGIMCSSKSACKSGDGKASYVIKAINKDIKEIDGSIRFSLGKDTQKSDVDYTLKALKDILKKLKKWYY